MEQGACAPTSAPTSSPAPTATPAPTVTPLVADDGTIRTAVSLWLSDRVAAIRAYDHISTWATGGVTDMKGLFKNADSFNEDIGAWDTSGVTSTEYMFQGASAFNQDLGDWAVQSVKDMYQMFNGASAFDQDLGWCVDPHVDLNEAFSGTQCASTSCGVQTME